MHFICNIASGNWAECFEYRRLMCFQRVYLPQLSNNVPSLNWLLFLDDPPQDSDSCAKSEDSGVFCGSLPSGSKQFSYVQGPIFMLLPPDGSCHYPPHHFPFERPRNT